MALDKDPSTMSSQSLNTIANNPNHPLHTHAKAELDRRSKKEGAMKRIATTQSSKVDRMASGDKKGLETFKKKEMKNEEKDPEEYDNEGSMMKTQLKQICSANEKLMSMVKDDDNLPEWVQSKVTKATDYIRSVRDYLEAEKMEEKTLTPAEIRKRDKIAKAIKKDDPDMPMDKKMAIATATAKRVAEAYKVGQTVKPTKGPHAGQDHEVIHVHGDGSYNIKPKNMPASRIRYRLGAARAKHDELKENPKFDPRPGKSWDDYYKKPTKEAKEMDEVSKDKLYNYMHKSADDVAKARGDARRQDKRIGGQKKADDKIRAMQGKRDAAHIKVPATEAKVDEISMTKLSKYAKAASKDIDQKRNKVRAALDQPASVKHATAGLDAMSGLKKRSKGSDMYVNKMTGRSKVKPTPESSDLSRIKKILKK
jgi:hypothetical protein